VSVPLHNTEQSPAAITLAWLIRLRWGAVLGQSVTIGAAAFGLGLDLPFGPLAALVLATAVSNLVLARWSARAAEATARWAPGAVLAADTLVLTALLYFSGGPSNPFSVLYLVHVTLAALVLGIRWAGAMVALSALSYAALFFRHLPVPELAHEHAHAQHAQHAQTSTFSVHLQGMWIAFTVTATLIAYFVTRLAEALRAREAELASAQRIAARNEKLASLTTLAAGAAHELGTPLGTIAIASKELERSIARAPEDALEDARLIRSEVERCRTIVRRMAAEAGEAVGEIPEPTTSTHVLAQLTARLEGLGITRVDVAAPPEASLVCPVEGLVQVLISLVQNALHASRESEARVTVRAESTETAVRFVVEDRGTGIPAELLSRLGEPFLTTKEPGEGMGLGLFLANAFAGRCSGSLVLSSEKGAGTRATLELPRASEVRLAG
jgi:two-component system, sensor histidine kinase RegB